MTAYLRHQGVKRNSLAEKRELLAHLSGREVSGLDRPSFTHTTGHYDVDQV